MQKLKKTTGRTRALREGTGIAVWAAAIFLTIMLLSYEPGAVTQNTQNLTGNLGKTGAEFFYRFLGYASFILIALIARWGYLLFFRQRQEKFSSYERTIRHLSTLLLLLSSATLFSIQMGEQTNLSATAGGEIGRILAFNMINIFGGFGSVFLLFSLVVISLGLLAELSWLHTLEQIGEFCLRIAKKLKFSLFAPFPVARPSPPKSKQTADIAADMGPEKKKRRWFFREKEKQPPSHRGRFKRVEPRFTFMPGQSPAAGPARGEKKEPSIPLPPKETGDIGTQHNTTQQPGAPGERSATAAEPPVVSASSRSIMQKLGTQSPPDAPRISPKSTPPNTGHTDSQANRDEAGTGSLPSADCLASPGTSEETNKAENHEHLEKLQQRLVEKLGDFGITVQPTGYSTGPVVTLFELEPAAGVKASRISNLATDLARSLAVDNIRVLEVMRGKSSIGVEIPNAKRRPVSLREVLTSRTFTEFASPLPVALGTDTEGKPVIASLAEMPHLLVAGTTGSGKSVGINAMLLSLLYRYSPQKLRLILVDPKMLELAAYNGIPHLLVPVITDMKDATKAINWCVKEMDERYKMMAQCGARSIGGYNRLAEAENAAYEVMPYVVVIIDEYADMIMTNKKIEKEIVRLAQKARAAGIHLILATQRPSVDVITGLIKANIPSRISFKVSARVDSRTVLDQNGAEQLLGKGDMLYISSDTSVPQRVHGEFVEETEVRAIVEHWKKQGMAEYREDVLTTPAPAAGGGEKTEEDELYADALAFVRENNRVSISSVQRRFKIGYNRAARIIDLMEENGVVSEMDSTGKRTLL